MKTIPHAAVLAAIIALCADTALALSIKEFRKYAKEEQGVYLNGAVSMAAFSYATTGQPDKGRCIQRWYFGKDASGPRDLVNELFLAERSDPDKYHVEGIILGLTDKVCPASPAQAQPSRP